MRLLIGAAREREPEDGARLRAHDDDLALAVLGGRATPQFGSEAHLADRRDRDGDALRCGAEDDALALWSSITQRQVVEGDVASLIAHVSGHPLAVRLLARAAKRELRRMSNMPMASGNAPRMAASVVMRMGRKRSRQASRMACTQSRATCGSQLGKWPLPGSWLRKCTWTTAAPAS